MSGKLATLCRALFVLATLSGRGALAQRSSSDRIELEVVDVAADRAYLQPGEAAGIRRGSTVSVNRRSYRVISVARDSAVIELGGARVARGTRAYARIEQSRIEQPRARPSPPAPLANYRGQWPRATLPASLQHPRPVPLGPLQASDRLRLALSLGGGANVPLRGDGTTIGRGQLRTRLHYEPLVEVPLRFDADVAAQLWWAEDLERRPGRDSQPLVFVRQLEASYGRAQGLFAGLGRLRYAARSLGMLDGARLQSDLFGGLSLGAFGGFQPDPVDGSVSTESVRFGAELAYEDFTHALRPRAVLTAHGSRYAGDFDERKLLAAFDLFPGASRAGAYAELSLYDGENPWDAPPQELSAAGVQGSVRLGELELGARVDMQRPERSRYLAAFLPQSYLCSTEPATPPAATEPCRGDDARYLAAGDATLHLPGVALFTGVSASTSDDVVAEQLAGFAGLRVPDVVERVRVDGSVFGSTGSLLRTIALELGVGTPLARGLLDVSLHYRPALTRYVADTGAFVEHTVGVSWFVLAPALDLQFGADAVLGRDVNALLIQALVTARLE